MCVYTTYTFKKTEVIRNAAHSANVHKRTHSNDRTSTKLGPRAVLAVVCYAVQEVVLYRTSERKCASKLFFPPVDIQDIQCSCLILDRDNGWQHLSPVPAQLVGHLSYEILYDEAENDNNVVASCSYELDHCRRSVTFVIPTW